MEEERWNKGQKTSKPHHRFVSINDFNLAMEQRYYENHSISVEILHDPTIVDLVEVKKPVKPATNVAKSTAPPKQKQDYVKELAEVLEIDPTQVDPTLSIQQLRGLIKEHKRRKGIK